MNAGIVSLQDGTPCIVYDEVLPHPISHVEFHYEDHCITLVYDIPNAQEKSGRKFEFPLDRPFMNLLRQRGNVAVASVKGKQLIDVKIYPVIFTEI